MIVEKKCKDFGDRPGCLGTIDDRYTLRFDDIGEEPIEFCAHCGPDAAMMNEALERAFNERGPEFAKQLSDALDGAEANAMSRRS